MEYSYSHRFLQVVNELFPSTIQGNSTVGELERGILFIRSNKNEFDNNENIKLDNTDSVNNVAVSTLSHDVAIFDSDNEAHARILHDLLDILDNNLGSTYEKVSEDIYENNLPWKVNKMREMETENLIYVYYYSKVERKIVLYMSFMLTEEMNVSKFDSIEKVIYLYEIQIIQNFRRFGLGKLLLGYLFRSAQRYNSKIIEEDTNEIEEKIAKSYQINSIALTVFSNNDQALKFYENLGFKLTADSPIDKVVIPISRRTRKKNIATKEEQEKIKPIYYLLYCPVSNSMT